MTATTDANQEPAAVEVVDDQQLTETQVGPERLAYSRKACLVGPSGAGKTSFVQSLKAQAPALTEEADRTLGIEIHKLSFEMEETETSNTQFDLSVWDFAGEDAYQSAHSLFFSKDALFLLCIDTKKYADTLEEADNMSMRAGEAMRGRYLTRNIFSWLRHIFARDPGAELLLVGTKTDRLKDEKMLNMVWRDLRLQLDEWKRRYMDEIETELRIAESHAATSADAGHLHRPLSAQSVQASSSRYSGSAHHANSFEELRERVKAISFDEWVTVGCTDTQSIANAWEDIKNKIGASENNVDMSGRNAKALQYIIERRKIANALEDSQERIDNCIVPRTTLFRRLMVSVPEFEDHNECSDIMHQLHELGEIAWFDHASAGPLQDSVILDPTIVISLVRETLNHDNSITSGDLSIVHFQEGRVTHEIMNTFPIWKDLGKDLSFAFKLLLQFFQLAYPANDQDVDWDSDLIIPAYWKIRQQAVDKRLLQQRTMMAQNGVVPVATACWEYELSSEVSNTIFEQFAVQSYTALFKRTVWPNCIESFVEGDFASRVAVTPSDATRDVICVEVAVENPEVRWEYLRYYAMTIEKVLDNYPGLSVSRYILDNEGNRHRLGEATSRLDDTIRRGQDEATVANVLTWMPPDLSWFMEKAWLTPGKLQQLQLRELMKQTVNRLDVLQKLIVADDSQRRYPALWTLNFNEAAKLIELRMLSDLSGKCFHPAIQIQVPSSFLNKYGSWIQNGLWVCSNVVPEVISLGIVQKVVDMASPLVDTHVERSQAVHSLIENLDLSATGTFDSRANRTLSPRGTVALLRDILRLYDGNFDELTICDLCNLECAATSDGHYIWAHRHEIVAMGDKLTACDRDDFPLNSVVDDDQTEDPADDQKDDEKDDEKEDEKEDPTSSSSSTATTDATKSTKSPQSAPSSPTNSQQNSSPPASPSTSPSTTQEKQEKKKMSVRKSTNSGLLPLNLVFETAEGLNEVDWNHTYIKWQMFYGPMRSAMAAGVTTQSADASSPPSWSSSPAFSLSCVVSVDMLRQCRLQVRLKRPSRFMVMNPKLIGEGVVDLRDFIPDDADEQQFECKPIVIDVGPGRRVTCSLSAA